MVNNALYWIENLGLEPHPEGGFYKEVYRSQEIIKEKSLPERYKGDRNFSTSIYFLLESNNPSKLHSLRSDEIWHFHNGSSLTLCIIDEKGILHEQKLGINLAEGEKPQVIIPNNCYFGAFVNDADSYSLMSCTVAPAFDFADFELPGREKLLSMFPDYGDIIERLT